MDCNPRRFVFLGLALAVPFCTSIQFACAATPAATTTTLTVSSGGNAVGTVTAGSVVTLTAAVSSNSVLLTVGQVNFCDASVTYCSDVHLLGTAQLTSAGTAVLKFLPAPGTHSYRAVFTGTKTMATSTSATSHLTVTGPSPSVTSLTSTGQVTVSGAGTTAPTGTVSLRNAANNSVITTGTLGAGQAAFVFVRTEFDPMVYANSAIAGDFNGDGFADIAEIASSASGNSFSPRVLLGDGTGYFKPIASSGIAFTAGKLIVSGDFNGDGVLDLAVGDGSSLNILLGNGDGTFKQGQTISVGSTFPSLVTADFNGDGIPDLAVLSPSSSVVYVYLGNGDGTFKGSPLAPPATGPNASAMVAGDFNNDGLTDLAVSGQSVEVFLSNGDGSFMAPITTAVSAGFIAACDFNGDGNLDLAASTQFSPTLPEFGTTILLGDGHGNFSPGQQIGIAGAAVGGPLLIACSDFNGDGKVDLIINFQMGHGTQNSVMLGNGDGTFGANLGNSDTASAPLALGDFNGDGLTDLVDSSIRYIAVTQTASVAFSGGGLPPGSGSQQVAANYPGDSNYRASASPAVAIQATQGTPKVAVTAPAASITQGSPLTLTATVTGSGLVPTGSVTLYDGSGLLGTVQLNSAGMGTYSAATLALGTNSITASYGGDANYVSATSPALFITVNAAGLTASTVKVTPASTSTAAGQALAVSIAVNGSAGGPTPSGVVNLTTGSYSSWQSLSSGAAQFTLPAGTLSSGPNTLTASYLGDPVYAAETATATVTVPQILVAIPAPPPVSAGGSATATVTFSSGSTYQGTLNLTCALAASPTGAQSLPTCTMNPTSLAIASGGTGTSVLSVHTTAASTASLRESPGGNLWRIGGGGAVLALLLMGGISSRRRRWISMLALLSVFAVVTAIGCGGSSTPGPKGTPATTAGNYVFTVTGADASNATITAATTVTVTVQ